MPKYLVETISMYRMRYVVECKNAQDAKDAVTMDEANEFGQVHIDENIIGCREVTDDEIEPLLYEDHPYLRSWVPGKAHEFVYVVDYDK